jgi:hypothetical protein
MTPDAPGRFGEQSPRDLVLCRASARMILSSYLAVARILGVPPKEPPDQEAEVTECREQVAEALAWVQPRWRGTVAEVMFFQATRWLETAETWDVVESGPWITGARTYLRVLAPPAHLAQAQVLAGHDAIAETQRGAPLLHNASPERLAWLETALAADPAAMIHTAAALTAWLWALPGVVRDPDVEQVTLAQLGVDDLKMALTQK